MKIRQEKERKQEELMEFLCSLKQQTSLDTLDFPEGFAMGPVEEINHLKTDDSKNKSTLSKITPQSKVTSLEKVQKALSNEVEDQSALQHDSKIKPQSKVIGLEQVAKAIPGGVNSLHILRSTSSFPIYTLQANPPFYLG